MQPGQRKRSAARARSADRFIDSAAANDWDQTCDPLLAEIRSWTHEPELIGEAESLRQSWSHRSAIKGSASYGSVWDDVVPLRRAEIRLRPRWRAAMTRKLLWGLGRRHAAMAGVMASCVLTAACASAVRTGPDQLQVAANSPYDAGSQAVPAYTRVSHAMRTAAAERANADRLIAPSRIDDAVASAEPTPVEGEAQASFEAPAHEAQSGTWPFHQDNAQNRSLTKLVAFSAAPFPYHGTQPTGGPFLDTQSGGELGHRTRRGAVLWESKTFGDSRVLVHVPAGFDPARPSAMVIFFHGYGATLSRDVLARQQVPAQISASGANVILVAPQFAVDARDPSIGHFWEEGGFNRFLDETAAKLAALQGDPSLESTFARMPIVMVAYSGGFYPAAWCIKDLGASHRVRGILMLDAAYGEFERYADWAAANRSSFLVSAYTHNTARQNVALRGMLAARGVPTSSALTRNLTHGAVFLPAEFPHQDYVTKAYTDDPIKDILTRLPEYRLYDPQSVATMDGPTRTASIH